MNALEYFKSRLEATVSPMDVKNMFWEPWCSLAVKAAVPLLEHGFKVKELYGGMAAWNTLNLPVEPVEGALL